MATHLDIPVTAHLAGDLAAGDWESSSRTPGWSFLWPLPSQEGLLPHHLLLQARRTSPALTTTLESRELTGGTGAEGSHRWDSDKPGLGRFQSFLCCSWGC